MGGSAVGTRRVAHAQALQPFGSGALVAASALLGGVALVNGCKPYTCVIALVFEHGPVAAPTRVQHGL
jgi:hypothetical protein